jgi:cobalamin biosynthesis Mg chelatase CobN
MEVKMMAEAIITTVADEGSLGAAVDASLAENTVDTANDGAVNLSELLAEPDAASDTANPDQADQAPMDQATDRQARATAGRVKEAERRAYQRAREELTQDFDRKLHDRLAPLLAAHVENTAREIAASEGVTIEVARELAAYRQSGAKQAAGKVEQVQTEAEQQQGEVRQSEGRQRDEHGRFQAQQAPQTTQADAGLASRGAFLREQAAEIKAEYGVDMLPLFKDDPEIRENVSKGKWDFWRALAAYDKRVGRTRVQTEQEPSVIRTSNSTDTRISIDDMGDDDIEKVLRAVRRGKAVRFD